MSYFSAGEWTVKAGHEDSDFSQAWLGSVEMEPPILGLKVRPRLLKDLNQPGHYRSFAEWESREAIEAFRARPDFPAVMARIHEYADFTIYTLEEVH